MVEATRKKDGKKVILYTGRELMIAIGEQLNRIHDTLKGHYDDLYDIESIGKNWLDVKLFENANEFKNCLYDGSTKYYTDQIINESVKEIEDKIKDGIYINKMPKIKRNRLSKFKMMNGIFTVLTWLLGIGIGFFITKMILDLISSLL